MWRAWKYHIWAIWEELHFPLLSAPEQTMQELQDIFLTDPSNQRNIPEWGRAIFSPLCVCMTPMVRGLGASILFSIVLSICFIMTLPIWTTQPDPFLHLTFPPKDGEELAGFMKYVVALHRAHLMLATLIQPVSNSTPRGALKAQELLESHKRCEYTCTCVGNVWMHVKVEYVGQGTFWHSF